jgi:hypothetical protein
VGQGSRRRRRRGQHSEQQSEAPFRKHGIKATIDSFGGFLTIGAVAIAIVVVILVILNARSSGLSSEQLLGEEIPAGSAIHIDTLEAMEIIAGQPPTGGPHFLVWLEPGIHEIPVSDGNAVHSLEHGMLWFSYNPALIADEDLNVLRKLAEEFDKDVLLSPRPANSFAIAAASWGRLLRLDNVDEQSLRKFVTTNRNRSPEPGVRGRGIMPKGSGE